MLNSDILYTAADNLERLSGFSINAELRPDSLNSGGEGAITIRKNGFSTRLEAEVKNDVHQSNLHFILQHLKGRKDSILVAKYISSPGKKVLEENRINYLDLAGNCHIETSSGIFFHIKGEKLDDIRKPKKHKAFSKNGIKLIYTLLLNEGLINEPYRQMADLTNISVSTVGGILSGLESENFILRVTEDEKKLYNKGELLSHWVRAFNQVLKPKLFRGRYRFSLQYVADSWKDIDLGSFAYWGGEPAADRYINFLYPEVWTLYTNLEKRALIKDFNLRPDPNNGMIEVYELFWKLESDIFVDKNIKAVSPLLAYAELLGTKESRNLEAAHRIYETYLKDLIE